KFPKHPISCLLKFLFLGRSQSLELERELLEKKRRRKLIIDRSIKLSSTYMRSRIHNIYVEVRAEIAEHDRCNRTIAANQLFARPARES
ncbi:unnamed protein product, partial [Leptidea sinapis]